ncbi:polyprenyl synthetase family protein [Clostridium sp. YIM B02515]|uniref:Polyprenyl synthetase family protein n=1 Tax=Clostridium rhizosphaerae TaxID=2803861 RepID=A0ABS1TEU7_9CLOT|nr:farnesyl diphosphate synthase [Clostridium rhizosphaerae]MBL4937904.1 polyprenyl synthetase family protein [Clostridium rhizosphaerae]
MESIKLKINDYLENYFRKEVSYNQHLYDAMAYSINLGGKRIRPILMLLTYSIYNDNYEKIMPIAAAIEMIHTYSLIHDDLPCMDDDDIRRGKPTNHKVFGESMAVLAGDALLNEAMNIMFDFCINNDKSSLRACRMISQAAGAEGMIGGQVVDILSEGKSISNEELLYMHNKKTGELIRAAVLAGAVIGGASKEEETLFDKFGEKLGLAFQIKDDILDITSSKEVLGKTVNSDINNNKTNFISMYGLEKCNELCENLTKECIDMLNKISEDTTDLKEITKFLLRREL